MAFSNTTSRPKYSHSWKALYVSDWENALETTNEYWRPILALEDHDMDPLQFRHALTLFPHMGFGLAVVTNHNNQPKAKMLVIHHLYRTGPPPGIAPQDTDIVTGFAGFNDNKENLAAVPKAWFDGAARGDDTDIRTPTVGDLLQATTVEAFDALTVEVDGHGLQGHTLPGMLILPQVMEAFIHHWEHDTTVTKLFIGLTQKIDELKTAARTKTRNTNTATCSCTYGH
jgi:hypothetical protein